MVETSIIIPTLNEEKYLPLLLDSIKKQTYRNYEVIVSDNNSKDKTKQIARKHKCKVVRGGAPSKARNNGAKVAKGKYLLFIDADVILPKKTTLNKVVKQFKSRKLDLAGIRFAPVDGDWRDVFLHLLYYTLVYILHSVEPYINSGFMICKKSLFKKLKGFDETIFLSEDCDFGRRARLLDSKISFLRWIHVNLSVRRFKIEGRIYLFLKYFSIPWYRVWFGEIRKGNKFYDYNWKYRKKI
jgi:glycosyltransferase involved in cell wall biosynthesis